MYQRIKIRNRIAGVWCLILLLLVPMGCKSSEEDMKLQDLNGTVMKQEDIPTPLKEELEVRQKEEFRITYEDGEYLYLCVGYGEQESGGYSIQVKEFGLYEDYILLDTTLIGPGNDEAAKKIPSYPYLVLRTEIRTEPVVFE